jgi:hypothetical protein
VLRKFLILGTCLTFIAFWWIADLTVSPEAKAGEATAYPCGDVDTSGEVNMLDILYLIAYLYKSGVPPPSVDLADVDNSSDVNMLDILALIGYLYHGGGDLDCPPDGSAPTGDVVGHTACKSLTTAEMRADIPPNQDCIVYQYDGESILQLKHVNAGFNCCPSSLVADISIEDNFINIVENEIFDTLGGCECLCLFDVDMEIINLPPGKYRIKVIELYLGPQDDTLEFDISLVSDPEGVFCVERNHYPWGDGSAPSGNLLSHSDCGTSSRNPDSLEEDCVLYDYDGNGTLVLKHVNDLFNCCADELMADIDIFNDTIYIKEYETFEDGGCFCLCLYDLDYMILNLSPGIYTIIVDNYYYAHWYGNDEIIVFSADLTSAASGYYCLDRPYLPWPEGMTLDIEARWQDKLIQDK